MSRASVTESKDMVIQELPEWEDENRVNGRMKIEYRKLCSCLSTASWCRGKGLTEIDEVERYMAHGTSASQFLVPSVHGALHSAANLDKWGKSNDALNPCAK